MGIQNTVTKNYMSRNDIFAELLNFYVFDGKPVIQPEDLREADSAENVILKDSSGKNIAVERYRDIFKQSILKLTNHAGFLLIGVENQSMLHFAMPVRSMLYDSLSYIRQISDTAKKHKHERERLSGTEFLSGFTKDDKLIPVITLVVYFGPEPWTAPCSLHQMLYESSSEILNCIPDYRINLVDPHQMTETDYCKMGEKFQYVMRFIGASNSNTAIEKLLHDFKNVYSHMERDAAELLKICTRIDIPIDRENEEVIDMCKGWKDMMEECTKKGREQGLEQGETIGRNQIKAAIKAIKNGHDTVELLVSQGFSEDTALDALEIASQFSC